MAATRLWIRTRGSDNGFHPCEFVGGLGASVLERTMNGSKVGSGRKLHASSPSARRRFLEVALVNFPCIDRGSHVSESRNGEIGRRSASSIKSSFRRGEVSQILEAPILVR